MPIDTDDVEQRFLLVSDQTTLAALRDQAHQRGVGSYVVVQGDDGQYRVLLYAELMRRLQPKIQPGRPRAHVGR